MGGEEGFGAEDVHAAFGINELGDIDVTGGGDEGVGVFAGEVGVVGVLVGEEGDHVADGHLGGGLKVFAEAHGDVGGGGFGAGPEEAVGIVEGALVEDELEGSGELGFEGGDVDLAVALASVSVADLEVGAFGVDRDVEGGPGDHLAVVNVAGVHPGWGGVVLAGGGGGEAHAAEEGVEWYGDAGGEVGGHVLAVEGDEFGAGVGEVVGEEAAAGTEGVAGPGDVEVDLLDAEFEDVAGFGVGDGDGAGEDVAAGAFVGCGVVGVDVADGVGDVGGGDADGGESLGWATGGEGLDGDGVAGVDGEDGFGGAGVEAPGDGGGGGEEGVGLLGVGGDGEGEENGGCSCGGRFGRDWHGVPRGPDLVQSLRTKRVSFGLGSGYKVKVLILKGLIGKVFHPLGLAVVVWVGGDEFAG